MARLFTGFSTVGGDSSTNFKLYDVDLIRQDLMNHFNTRIGERVMRPEFGCRIWDYLMEPFTDLVKQQVTAEAIRVCNQDPRVEVVNATATRVGHMLQVDLELRYIPLKSQEQLSVSFDSRQG